uniref:G-protein coupled receptors family 1 profile domain-containing protein n=1 Tax=Globodera rostochiensis TaxID=31243 RepID=A0A914GWK2_GLORO
MDDCAPLSYAVENISRYVYEKLGQRCAMPSIVLPTAIIYGLILLFGILGNLCTCLVILRNKCMQNPTNYYLFSLAVSDLLLLVLGLPMELYGVFGPIYPYKFGEFVCKGRAFLIEFTSYASILTITCFSVERWLAICFPLRIKLFSTFDRAVSLIIAVWLGAFLAASPVLSIVVVNKLPVPEWAVDQPWLSLVSSDGQRFLLGTETCAMDFMRPLAQRNFIFLAFSVFFLLPAFLITLVYFHIVYRLCASGHSSLMAESVKQKIRSRKSLLKILVSVVVMFFLCWLPFHVQRLLSVYLNESSMESVDDEQYTSAIHTLFSIVFYISGYCYYSNSACNPILYNILSAKYRMAFCKTILGERFAYKILYRKCRANGSVIAGGGQHSHFNSKMSTGSSMQWRTTLSPKMSSMANKSFGNRSLATFTLNSPLPTFELTDVKLLNQPPSNAKRSSAGLPLRCKSSRSVPYGDCETFHPLRRSFRRSVPPKRTTTAMELLMRRNRSRRPSRTNGEEQ